MTRPQDRSDALYVIGTGGVSLSGSSFRIGWNDTSTGFHHHIELKPVTPPRPEQRRP